MVNSVLSAREGREPAVRACGSRAWPPLPSPPTDAATRPAGVALKFDGPLRIQFSGPASEVSSARSRCDPCEAKPAGKAQPDYEAPRSAAEPKGPPGEQMQLHAIVPEIRGGGVMALDRGRFRIPDARERQSHERTIGQGGSQENTEKERWKTSAMANQDGHKIRRATRQLARRKMLDAERNHNRCRGNDEDEEVALSLRREAQEDEWRRMLRKHRAAAKGIELGSHASAHSTLLSTALTSTTAPTSKVTAGIRTQEVTWRQDDNCCAAYGRQCLALCPGDATSKDGPVPLAKPVKPKLPLAEEYEAVAPVDHLDRLSRLLRMPQ